jgi:hypothetical protein
VCWVTSQIVVIQGLSFFKGGAAASPLHAMALLAAHLAAAILAFTFAAAAVAPAALRLHKHAALHCLLNGVQTAEDARAMSVASTTSAKQRSRRASRCEPGSTAQLAEGQEGMQEGADMQHLSARPGGGEGAIAWSWEPAIKIHADRTHATLALALSDVCYIGGSRVARVPFHGRSAQPAPRAVPLADAVLGWQRGAGSRERLQGAPRPASPIAAWLWGGET